MQRLQRVDERATLPHLDVHRSEGAGHRTAEDVDHAGALLTLLDHPPPRTAAAPHDRAPAPAQPGLNPGLDRAAHPRTHSSP